MKPPAVGKAKQGYSRFAFGLRIHLWQESEVDWCATIFDDDNSELSSRFEEDNLTLAKLHILAEARNRAVVRWKDRDFPTEDTLVDSWEEIALIDGQAPRSVF